MRALLLGLLLLGSAANAASLQISCTNNRTIATAGVRTQAHLATMFVWGFWLQANKTNTGKVYVGDSSVASTRGLQLEPGETFVFPQTFQASGKPIEIDLNTVYVDVSVNGEGFKICWYKYQ